MTKFEKINRVLVIAGNYKEFKEYVYSLNDLPKNDYILNIGNNVIQVKNTLYTYISSPDQMRGYKASDVIYIGTYDLRHNKDLDKFKVIEQMCKLW